MVIFPDPENANEDGLVAVGGELNNETITAAYQKGIFPWPQEGLPWLWFCPNPRGVLDFEDFHVAHSLKKEIKRQNLDFTKFNVESVKSGLTLSVNQNFSEVIANCRLQSRPGQEGTWILPEMQKAYENLFKLGGILSFEVWESSNKNKVLIGGLYGVKSKNYFSAESMFYKKSNASKIALVFAVEYLKQMGMSWMDVQMVTPVSESFGAKYISRKEFLSRIR
jgi:leucyl/phenylalanyl-tRNA---protein transferase